MTVLVPHDQDRTFREAVSILLQSAGMPQPATLAGANKNVAAAMSCVNRAAEIIWSWTDWPWKLRFHKINLVANQVWYELPTDFDEAVGPPLGPQGALPIQWIEYRKLIESVPGFRFTPEFMGLPLLTEQAEAQHFQGAPQWYTIVPSYVGFYPMPNAEFVGEIPSLVQTYMPTFVVMFGDGDFLPLPRQLYTAHHFLSLGLFKQGLEYGDAMADQNTGYELIKKAVARKRMYGEPSYTMLPQDGG